jgi:hypothetical protein
MYMKVISNSERRIIHLTECDTAIREKYFLDSREELQALTKQLKSYTNVGDVDPLDEGWDWEKNPRTRWLRVTVHRNTEVDSRDYETYLLWNSLVYFMNESGATIDTVRI